MKFLLRAMEKSKPLFQKGGKLERLAPLYEAQETFLFTPADVTPGAPHVRDSLDLKRYMITVLFALLPALFFGIWNAGHMANWANGVKGASPLAQFGLDLWNGAWKVLPIVLTSYAVGGFWEVLFACTRKHEINEGFLVTGMLFPLTLPPTIPLWQVAAGISFGVVIGKEIFGGTGFNVLNPALTARAFLFFAYPSRISGDSVWIAVKDPALAVEGFSGATPLSLAAAEPVGGHVMKALEQAGFTLRSMTLGVEGGSIGETSLIAIGLGAALLLLTGVASWRIMAGGLLGLAATASIFNAFAGPGVSPYLGLPFLSHLAMGGFAFGLVFMATDPVSSAATPAGKWIYGFLIGAMTIVVRVANPAFPEGAMLSILFLNVLAPLIDYIVLQVHVSSRRRYLERFRHA
jgi:Na+-transporting NADH:ubiquinone oxidoreductase subunit B